MTTLKSSARLLIMLVNAVLLLGSTNAFQQTPSFGTRSNSASRTQLFGTPMGPMARAKKMMEPEEYNRVVEEKMKQSGMTREEAESEYNAFLENPPEYYALDQKEKYYRKMGYKNSREGRIAEAEKEGRGDEVRAQIEAVEQQGKFKAFGVLGFFVAIFLYLREMYQADPENFNSGIL
mmetsp:Transcript_7785/g.11908  ORF Transcript_7785/g.11908 Transcript_7785/m.11908 type:complete len:178 (-) Transcript_7785:230-763(-)